MTSIIDEPADSRTARVLWPVTPASDESLLSVVRRTAYENVHPHTLSLMRTAGTAYGHRLGLVVRSDEQIMALAHAIGLDPADALLRAPRLRADGRVSYMGGVFARDALETRRRRFAPGSLTISPHHRAVWDNRILTYCPITWEMLLDRCHACGSDQKWHRAKPVERCDACDADLRHAVTEPVDPTLRADLTMVNALLFAADPIRTDVLSELPPQLRLLPPEVLLDVLVGLMPLVDGRTRQDFFRIMDRRDPGRRAENLAAAAGVLRGWPRSIEDAFRETEARLGRPKARLRWSKVLEREFWQRKDEWMIPIAAALRSAVPQPVRPIRASEPAPRTPRYQVVDRAVNSREFARRTGLATREIADHRRLGHLTWQKVRHGDGVTIAYNEAEVQQLQGVLRDGIGWEVVARELGITRHGVEQLACMRLLSASEHPVVLALRGPLRFRKADLEHLSDRLLARAHAGEDLSSPLPLTEAIQMQRGLKPWGPALEALLTGSIPFAVARGRGALADRLLIDRAGLPGLRQLVFDRAAYPDFPFEQHAGIRDALNDLGLGPKALPALRAYGASEVRGANKTSVLVKAIDEVAADFVTSRELSLRSGKTVWDVIKRLRSRGFGKPTALGWPRLSAEEALADILVLA